MTKQLIKTTIITIFCINNLVSSTLSSPSEKDLKKFKSSKIYKELKKDEESRKNSKLIETLERNAKKFKNENYDFSAIETTPNDENSKLIEELNDVKFEEVMNNAKLIGDEVINAKIDAALLDYQMEQELYKRNDYFTLFYFISRSIDFKAVEQFVEAYNKLKIKNPNVDARIIFNGYPTFYGLRTVGKIKTKTWLKKQIIKSKFGEFTINEDAIWEYKINKKINTRLLPKLTIFNDFVNYKDLKTKKLHKLEVELKVVENEVKVVVKNSFDGMYHYLNEVREHTSLKPDDLSFYVNPWTFNKFNLQKVPAFSINKCKKPFKFKNCEGLYLAKGEMELAKFFEILGDEEDKYKKFYFDLIEAK